MNPQRKPGEGFLFLFFFFPFALLFLLPGLNRGPLSSGHSPASRGRRAAASAGSSTETLRVPVTSASGRIGAGFSHRSAQDAFFCSLFFSLTLKVNSGDARLAASAPILPQQEDPCSAAILSLLLLQLRVRSLPVYPEPSARPHTLHPAGWRSCSNPGHRAGTRSRHRGSRMPQAGEAPGPGCLGRAGRGRARRCRFPTRSPPWCRPGTASPPAPRSPGCCGGGAPPCAVGALVVPGPCTQTLAGKLAKFIRFWDLLKL